MNTKFRKLLSYVLAAAMIFSLMPQATKVVYADGISASVEQKEIKGDVGNQISNMEITITLTGDDFITLQNQEDVKSWFGTGFPQGMEAKVKGEPEDNSVTIAFSGTPTERKYAVMDITIPQNCLSSSTSPLKVTGNEKAAFYIGPEYVAIDAQSGLPTISATCGTGLDAENTFKVLLKEGIKFKAKADTEADLKQWFKNVPQGATIKLTEQIEDDATSATFKVEGNISEAGVKKIIPNFPKADALKDDSNLLDQLSHLTFLKEKEYVTLDVKPKLTVSGDGIIGKKGQDLTSKQVIITVEGDTFKDSLNSSVDWIYNISDLLLTQTVSFDGARKVATIELTGTPAIGIPETGVRVRIPENVFTHYGAKGSSGNLEIDSDDVKVNIADTSSDATVKKADSAEADYQIEENTITGVPAGTVQDLKADILVNHAAASLKVVAAETFVTNAQEFDSAQDLDNGVSLASGQKVAVKAEDGTTVKVYTITLLPAAPLPKSANVADVVVSGKAGAPVSAELSITLANESFNIGRVKSGAVVTDWFKNMPNGLNAVVKNVEGQYNTKVIITISGTPNAEFVAPISIVIPASGLLVSQEALNVEPNERASFDIKKADSSEDNSSGNSGSGSGGGSGSGSTSSSSDNSSASNKASTPSKTEVQTVKPSVKVAGNTLQAEVSSSSVKEAIKKDKEIEKNGLEIKVDTKVKASDASVKLPKDAVNAIAGSKAKELRINTPLASVNFDLNAIKEINDKASKGVELSIKKVESASLHNEAKTLVGDRPVYDLKVLAENGESVSSFGEGKATVSIPYAPKAEEDTSRLTVYYISDEGVMEQMEDARYDAGKKAIVFTAEHFSVYAVGEKPEKAMFMDIEGHWAKDDIAYVSKKGLMKGVSEVYFAPNTAVTRGMFVTVIGRMAGAEVSAETPTFSDVDANKYYAPYVAWAAEQGIVKGMSETSFMPDAEITREQMAVIIDGYAKLAKMELSEKNAEMKFEDEAMIGDWSKESIKMMQKAGILSGKENNYFDPKGMATRAEVAKVIRLLMSK